MAEFEIGPIQAEQREREIADLIAAVGGTRKAALGYWCANRVGLSEAARQEHLREGSLSQPVSGEAPLIERLKAAVWMVGNMDTVEDKRAWWATFDDLWKEVATDPRVQDYADREFLRRTPPLPTRAGS